MTDEELMADPGPAPSGASTSETGGLPEASGEMDPYKAVADAMGAVSLTDTMRMLEASTRALARLAQAAANEVEGRRRELWDALVAAARIAEIGGRPAAQLVGDVSPDGYAR